MGYTPRPRIIGDWFSLFSRGRKKPAAQARTGAIRSRRLRHEPLEDRRVLAAVITVNTDLDGNDRDDFLTLREATLISNRTLSVASLTALEQAQVSGTPTANDADTIEFTSALQGNPIDLTVAHGHLEITESLVIDGSMVTGGVTISGNDPDEEQLGDGIRIFNISDLSGGTDLPVVELRSLTLINGDPETTSEDAAGGAIRSEGILSIYESSISNNFAGSGGGIYSVGPLTVEGSTISSNETWSSVVGGGGGGIRALDATIIIDSTIEQNLSFHGGGGGIHITSEEELDGPLLTLDGVDVLENTAKAVVAGTEDGGGGIKIGSSEVAIEVSILGDSLIKDNVAGATDDPQNPIDAGGGGGIFWGMFDGSILHLEDSTIEGNKAAEGGGMYISTIPDEEATTVSLIMEGATIRGNKAIVEGGGIRLSTGRDFLETFVSVIDSVIENNEVGEFDEAISAPGGKGGGIYLSVESGPFDEPKVTMTFANSLITGNTAIPNDGITFPNFDIFNDARGGGIYVSMPFSQYPHVTQVQPRVSISGAVVHNNSANSGAGLAVGAKGFGYFGTHRDNAAYGGTFTLSNSVVESNNATNSGGGMFLAISRQGQFTIGVFKL